jgi:hypothetical protein
MEERRNRNRKRRSLRFHNTKKPRCVFGYDYKA